MERATVGTRLPRKSRRKGSKKNKADSVSSCNPGDVALCRTANMQRDSSPKHVVDSCVHMHEEVLSCGAGVSLSLENKLGAIKSFNLNGKQGDKGILGLSKEVKMTNAGDKCFVGKTLHAEPFLLKGKLEMEQATMETRLPRKRKRRRSKKNKADSITNCNPGDVALCKTTSMQRDSSPAHAVVSCIQMDEEVPPCGTRVSLSLEKKSGDIKCFDLDRKGGDKRILDHLDLTKEVSMTNAGDKCLVGRTLHAEPLVLEGKLEMEQAGVETRLPRKRRRKRSKKNKLDSVTNCNTGDVALCQTTHMQRDSSPKHAVDSCIQTDEEVPPCDTRASLSLEKKSGDIKCFDLDRKQGDKRILDRLDLTKEVSMINAGDKCLVGRTLHAEPLVLKGKLEMEQAVVETRLPRKRGRKRLKKNKLDSVTNCNTADVALCQTTHMQRDSSPKHAVDSCIQMDEEVLPCGARPSLSLEKKLCGIKSFNLDRKQGDKRILDPLGLTKEVNMTNAGDNCLIGKTLHAESLVLKGKLEMEQATSETSLPQKRKRKRSKKNKGDGVTNSNPGVVSLSNTTNMQRDSSLEHAVDSRIQMDEEVPPCGTGMRLSLEKKLGGIKSFNLDRKEGDKTILDHLDLTKEVSMTNSADKCLVGKTLHAESLVLKGKLEMEQATLETSFPQQRKRKRSKKNKGHGVTSSNPGDVSLCNTMQRDLSPKHAVDSCIQMDEEVPPCGTGASLFLEKKLGDIKSFELDRKGGDKKILDHLDVMDHSNHASEISKLDPVGRSSEMCPGLHIVNKEDVAKVSVSPRRKRNKIHHRMSEGSNSSVCSLPSTGGAMVTCLSAPLLQTNSMGEASSGFVDAELKSGFSENANKVAGEDSLLKDTVGLKPSNKPPEQTNGVARGLTHDGTLTASNKDGHSVQISESSSMLRGLPNPEAQCSRRKLLILDLNGLLADIVSEFSNKYKPNKRISGKAVFKRPFCDDFLKFCLERFDVGVWSSRTRKNVAVLVDFLLGVAKHKLLFCWDQSHCTKTGYSTMENKDKPLFLKELKKIWDKKGRKLPWKKGQYDESNTLLLDDTPYKALRNPQYTALFPHPYMHKNVKDTSLGPGGDLRVYLERLAAAENVQTFVKENPFGQKPITKSSKSWHFYSKIIGDELSKPNGKLQSASAS